MKNTFTVIDVIDYKKSRYAHVFMIGSVVLFLILGGIWIILTNSYTQNGVGNPWFLLGCIAYIVLHELIYLFFMRFFSKERVHVSVKFPTISVGSSGKFYKRQFLIIILAPVVLLGTLLALLLLCSPREYMYFLSVLLILNFAGSGGDYLQAFVIRNYASDTLFQDNSDETTVYRMNQEA